MLLAPWKHHDLTMVPQPPRANPHCTDPCLPLLPFAVPSCSVRIRHTIPSDAWPFVASEVALYDVSGAVIPAASLSYNLLPQASGDLDTSQVALCFDGACIHMMRFALLQATAAIRVLAVRCRWLHCMHGMDAACA